MNILLCEDHPKKGQKIRDLLVKAELGTIIWAIGAIKKCHAELARRPIITEDSILLDLAERTVGQILAEPLGQSQVIYFRDISLVLMDYMLVGDFTGARIIPCFACPSIGLSTIEGKILVDAGARENLGKDGIIKLLEEGKFCDWLAERQLLI